MGASTSGEDEARQFESAPPEPVVSSSHYWVISQAMVTSVRQELARAGVFPVLGYHGTSKANAESILGVGFHPSSKPADWLGDGTYFWEEDSGRAKRWAVQHFGNDAVVLGALIWLDGCMNLLGSRDEWIAPLQDANRELRRLRRKGKLRLPKQTAEAHRRDREVFNLIAQHYAEQRNLFIRSVREVFVEGTRIFPHTAIHDLSHVQIAVRDDSVIAAIWHCDD